MIHTTIGVYLNGSFKVNGVATKDLEDHINYNKQYRPGRALFVDGKCIYKGYLLEDQIKKFEAKIRCKRIKKSTLTKPYR